MKTESSTKQQGTSTLQLSHHVSRAMVWNAVLFPFKFAVAITSGILLVRILSKHDYAIYTLVLSVAAMIGSIVDLGIERSVAKFSPEVEKFAGRQGLNRFFLYIFGIKLALIAGVVACFLIAPGFFIHALALGEEGPLLLWGVAALVFLGIFADVFIQLLYTHFRQLATNLLDLISAFLQPLAIIVLVLLGSGVPGILAAMIVSSLLLDLLSGWRAVRLIRSVPAVPAPRLPPNLLGRFTRISALNYFLILSVNFSDLPFAALVLTANHQLTGVAVLGVAYKIQLHSLRFLVAPLRGIQTPLFSRLFMENRYAAIRTAYTSLTKFLAFAIIPSIVAICLLVQPVIPVLFTTVYDEAILPSVVLVACFFTEAMLGIPQNMLVVFEKYRLVVWIRLVTLASIPLTLLLVPLWGPLGAALGIGLPRVAASILATAFVSKEYGIRFPFAFLGKVALASVGLGAALWFAVPMGWAQIGIALVIGVVSFWAIFKLLGGFDAADKERLQQLRLPFQNMVLRLL